MESSTASITRFPRSHDARQRDCQNCLFWMQGTGCCHCEGERCHDATAVEPYRFWRPLSAQPSRPPFGLRPAARLSGPSIAA